MSKRPLALADCRSFLFVPGSDERKIQKALLVAADAVVLDLEDAVAEGRKESARAVVARNLARFPANGTPCVVRIGALEAQWEADLHAVVRPGLDAIRLPKVQDPEHVRKVASALDTLERTGGVEQGSVRLQCTIESAAAVLRAEQIAVAHPRVEALVFGYADFTADIGVKATVEGYESLVARSWLVLCSRAAGIGGPLDGAFTDLSDTGGLRRSVEQARSLGYRGKSAIHPKQLTTINLGFSPSAAEVAEAKDQLATYEAGLSQGIAAVKTAGGQFVDEAVARRARSVIARAEPEPARHEEEPG